MAGLVYLITLGAASALYLPTQPPGRWLGAAAHPHRCRIALVAVDRTSAERDLLDDISLPTNADPQTLKRRYKQLATKLHPDVKGGDADKFVQLSAEYTRLKAAARKNAERVQANTAGGLSAMLMLSAAALYGTSQDPIMPTVLMGLSGWLAVILAEAERENPQRMFAAVKLRLPQGALPA